MDKPWQSLDTEESFDTDNVVKWPAGYEERVLPPLILFAYFSYREDIPMTWRPPWYDWRPGLYQALRSLFNTGNERPVVPFETTNQSLQREMDGTASKANNSLARQRATREFRACLWFPRMHLWRHNGGQTRFSISGTYEVGWTAPGVNSLNQRSQCTKDDYERGYLQVWPKNIKPSFEDWGVNVKIDVGFRIRSRLVRGGSYLVFFSGVPYMCMSLDLQVRTDGNHIAVCNGTYIPSQIYQTNTELKTYDMVDDIGGWHNVKKTLKSGSKAKPPYRGEG